MPNNTPQLKPIAENMPERLPPQNTQAEQSLLGALMLDKDAIIKIADILRPEDCYKKTHGMIFQAMIDLYSKHQPIDLLSLSNRLEEKKQIEQIGGLSYLTNLVTQVPSAAHVVHYAKIIQHKASLRRLIQSAAKISELGFREDQDIDEILDQAEQEIFSVSQKHVAQDFLPLKSMLSEAFERIDSLHKNDGKLRGLSTGFIDIDNKLAGLQKSDMITLAARPSLGKTSLALDIARHVASHEQVPVGIFSLEMSKDQLVDRLICANGSIDLWKYRTGKLSDHGENNEFAKINQAIDVLSKAPIFIDDSSASNIMQMRTMARRLQSEQGLGLLIIDYLQLMQGSNSENRTQEISEISRSLKTLARELNIPILAISQLSRAVEQRTDQIPKLSDLRESGSIEQDSDVVLFIYREDRVKQNSDQPNIADIIIAKHRNGPVGRTQLYFNEDYASFRSLEKYHSET